MSSRISLSEPNLNLALTDEELDLLIQSPYGQIQQFAKRCQSAGGATPSSRLDALSKHRNRLFSRILSLSSKIPESYGAFYRNHKLDLSGIPNDLRVRMSAVRQQYLRITNEMKLRASEGINTPFEEMIARAQSTLKFEEELLALHNMKQKLLSERGETHSIFWDKKIKPVIIAAQRKQKEIGACQEPKIKEKLQAEWEELLKQRTEFEQLGDRFQNDISEAEMRFETAKNDYIQKFGQFDYDNFAERNGIV